MYQMQVFKTFVLLVALGFLAASGSEARSLNQPEDFLDVPGNYQQNAPNQLEVSALQQQQMPTKANLDLDDDDDDDDGVELQPALRAPQLAQAGSAHYRNEQPIMADQAHQTVPSAADLKPAASKHYHHGHGAKGWLDMGAWTGKKGAFGWYDKHPVGKGK